MTCRVPDAVSYAGFMYLQSGAVEPVPAADMSLDTTFYESRRTSMDHPRQPFRVETADMLKDAGEIRSKGDEEKRREPSRPTNRFGEWQALKKGPRQHFGNRTVIFTSLDHDVVKTLLEKDHPDYEFEMEPALRGQEAHKLWVVQSMEKEIEDKLNDPDWQRIYRLEYEFETTDWFVPLSLHEGGGFQRVVNNWEVDANGMPFVETLAVYERGVLNCDTEQWKANVR